MKEGWIYLDKEYMHMNHVHESRQVRLAREILESAGYKVSSQSQKQGYTRMKEAEDPVNSMDSFSSVFKKFTTSDASSYAGAEPLPGGDGPFIAHSDDADIVVSGDANIFIVSIYSDEDDGYFIELNKFNLAKHVALHAYTLLQSGKSTQDVAAELDMDSFF